MTYVIRFTNNENGTLTVQDNGVNTETDLSFPGDRYTGYGQIIGENFLHLLENFASPSEPASPVQGQLWYKTSATGNVLQIYDGTEWTSAGGLRRSASRPDAAVSNPGDLWSDTESNQLYLWTGTSWILVGPEYSDGLTSGTVAETIIDSTDQERVVLKQYISGVVVAVIATDQFIPKLNIPGFSTIYPGVNLASSSYSGSGTPKYYGVSETTESLLINNAKVPSARFLRTDVVNITNERLKIKNNDGIELGLDSQMSLNVASTTGTIEHKAASSSINIKVTNDTGQRKTVLHINPNSRVGINTTNPSQALDVVGSIKSSASVLAQDLIISNNASVSGDLEVVGDSTFENVNAFNILPVQTESYNLGSSALKWDTIYASTVVANVEGEFIGNLSGNATTASRLQNNNTLSIGGVDSEITADPITFDGSGQTLQLSATVSPGFILNKDTVTTSELGDEFLVQRGVGLFKISQANLFSSLPRTPTGAMMPYAGQTAPSGWLLCDGSEVNINEYPELYEIIGYTYKSVVLVAEGKFALPDLRGRMPLGLDNMGGTSADRVTDPDADTLGGFGGQEQITVDLENLPDHEHNMRAYDSEGNPQTQFYAIRDVNEVPSDENVIAYDSPTGTQSGQALPSSGKILTDGDLNQPINVINPFLAMNYIIYTGRDE